MANAWHRDQLEHASRRLGAAWRSGQARGESQLQLNAESLARHGARTARKALRPSTWVCCLTNEQTTRLETP